MRGTRRAGATALIFLMGLAVLGITVASAVALSSTGWQPKSFGKRVVAIGALTGYVGLTLIRKRQASASSDPMELRVPWTQVKKALHQPHRAGIVLIHVKRSILNT